MDLKDAEKYYASIGFSRRTGFGERPAILIIDWNHGWSDPAVSPMAISMDPEIKNIRRLLDLARGKGFPVVHTTVVYTDEHFRDGGWFIKKVPSLEVLRPRRTGPSCPIWPNGGTYRPTGGCTRSTCARA